VGYCVPFFFKTIHKNMPYKIIKARGKKAGYYVKNLDTGHKFSNTPIAYDQALKQLAVLQLRKRGVPPLERRRSSSRKSSPKRRRSSPRRLRS
jgi:hypothetical protein